MIRVEVEDRLAEGAWLRLTMSTQDQRATFLLADRELVFDERRYRIRERDEVRDGATTLVEVEAEEIYVELAERLRVGDFTLVNATPDQMVETILDGSGWSFESSDSNGDADQYAIGATDSSVLSLLYEAAKITGYELRFLSDRRIVTLAAPGGADRGVGFRYGKNIRSLRRTTQAPAATRLYAFGASGLDISGRAPGGVRYVEDFSHYTDLGLTLAEARDRFTRAVQWTDSSFKEDGALYRAALDKVAELATPTVSYELDVADLSSVTGAPEDSFRIGDTVRVRDPELGIDVATRVVRIRRFPLSPSENEIELAFRPDLSGLSDGGERSKDPLDWILLDDDNGAPGNLGADWSTILAEIGVSFVQGGNAVHSFDVNAETTGSGVATFSIFDSETSTAVREWEEPFDGSPLRVTRTWSERGIAARGFRYQLRATISSGSGTVAIPEDRAHYWILAQGGLGSLPTPPPNRQCFAYTGEDQFFTVPDGVTSVAVSVRGGSGGRRFSGGVFSGFGHQIGGRLDVTPGEVLRVRVGDRGDYDNTPSGIGGAGGGWPGGGDAARTISGADNGYSGGGYSAILRAPYRETSPTVNDFLLVAGAGGGSHDAFQSERTGGSSGGFPTGADSADGLCSGGTQTGAGPTGEYPGGWLTGGSLAGLTTGNFSFPSGGAGAGWYGGNASMNTIGNRGADGGGGSSYFDSTAVDAITETSGGVEGPGEVCFEWDTPDGGAPVEP